MEEEIKIEEGIGQDLETDTAEEGFLKTDTNALNNLETPFHKHTGIDSPKIDTAPAFANGNDTFTGTDLNIEVGFKPKFIKFIGNAAETDGGFSIGSYDVTTGHEFFSRYESGGAMQMSSGDSYCLVARENGGGDYWSISVKSINATSFTLTATETGTTTVGVSFIWEAFR